MFSLKNWLTKRRKSVAPTESSAPSQGEHPSVSADHPIVLPAEDLFGLDPFARTIAASMAKLDSPEGVVIGVHGPWGCGKSSVINLIKHHLGFRNSDESGDLTIIDFNPWWFAGSEGLALAFFRELGSKMERSLSEKAKDAFRSLSSKIGAASGVVGAVAAIASHGAATSAASGAAKAIGDVFGSKRTMLEEHTAVSQALKESGRRFLIVIDDIDRLSVDEALLIFKLVKSAGRLPNVIYLLAFDLDLVQQSIATKYASEGPHFLEKILQASFRVPAAREADLRNMLLARVARLLGNPEESEVTRFMNVYYAAVAPWIVLPRDVTRLFNAMEVTWPAVMDNVDIADFLGIECLRLTWPKVHQAVHDNKTLVCGNSRGLGRDGPDKNEADRLLLVDVKDEDRPGLRRALERLFPALEGIWGNHLYADESQRIWRRQRRICSSDHFDTYFRFSISDAALRKNEIDQLIARSGEGQFMKEMLLSALQERRGTGGTRAALILDELTVHAPLIPAENIGSLVAALFEIADQLDVEVDKAGAFAIGSNHLRIHWLLNSLVADRLDLRDRDAVFERACPTAATTWLADFAKRCLREYEPGNDAKVHEGRTLVSKEAAERLQAIALAALERAAGDGSLLNKLPDFMIDLWRWEDFAGEGGQERVREWFLRQFDDDAAVVIIANALISHGWSHSAGDHVARRTTVVNAQSLRHFGDADLFLKRIDEILAKRGLDNDSLQCLERFKLAWNNPDDRFRDQE